MHKQKVIYSPNEEDRYNQWLQLGNHILSELKEAIKTGDPAGPAAQKVAAMHSQWLKFTLPDHTLEDHAYLIKSYANDERFAAYYDTVQPGASDFLCEAVLIYTKSHQA